MGNAKPPSPVPEPTACGHPEEERTVGPRSSCARRRAAASSRRTPRRMLGLAAALITLVALPASASAAGTITDFSVKRTHSLPTNVLNQLGSPLVLPGSVSGNPQLAPVIASLNGLEALTGATVASPLGFPSSAGPIIGVGPAGSTCSPPASVFAGGVATPNTVADQCDAFLRFVNGKHEHSPGAFPGLLTSASFSGSPSRFNLHLPPGALGNPY